jgi:undecaprenyl pyrophosphate phosphatase UppP
MHTLGNIVLKSVMAFVGVVAVNAVTHQPLFTAGGVLTALIVGGLLTMFED